MSGAHVLATFLHVSDLHIGEIDPVHHDARISPALMAVARRFTWLDGLLGHHGEALQALEEFIENELRAQGEEPHVIVSGDFTRAGDPAELPLAREYVQSAVNLGTPAKQRFCGLMAGGTEFIAAGNHDHWGGTPPPKGGAPSSAWAQLAAAAPRVMCPAVPLANGRDVVFIRIDSDADVAARTLNRTLALGDFLSQINDAGSIPPQRPGHNDIRVMLIHHSWHQGGMVLRMTDGSKRELGRFLQEHDICAILTGHSHLSLLQPFHAYGPSAQRRVYELRCGSSTQYDLVPTGWLYHAARQWAPALMPQRPGNSLLVHRIRQHDDGSTWWEAESYDRAKRRFKRSVRPGSSVRFQV